MSATIKPTTAAVSDANLVNVTIDGQRIAVAKGTMLIEAAEQLGIYIPRFCYHKKLSVAANCRMCLVEVAKAAKPLPACATPVGEGMEVQTKSAKAVSAQTGTMEFLLINHPLDCPICDQGGECELQDIAMGYGKSHSKYQEEKRVVLDKNLGPLISTEMTRCIHCTRCVRFGEEIAGVRELGATGRGENTRIETYIEQAVTSELSGNVIDLCPVGALTAKPSRFTARSWELLALPTVSLHDAWGSNLELHYDAQGKGTPVKRVVPRDNEAVNETWLSDRDRYSYTGLQHADLLKEPEQKINGQWQKRSWDEAFAAIDALLAATPPADIAALASANVSNEELYLLQKYLRHWGVAALDFRVREADLSLKATGFLPELGCTISDLAAKKTILLLGSNIRQEIPLAALRVRQAQLQGAQIFAINPRYFDYNFDCQADIAAPVTQFAPFLAQVLQQVLTTTEKPWPTALPMASDWLTLSPAAAQAAEATAAALLAKPGHLLLGQWAQLQPEVGTWLAYVAAIAQATGSSYGVLPLYANALGAHLTQFLPSEPSRNAQAILAKPPQLLLTWQLELDDFIDQKAANALFSQSQLLAFTSFADEKLRAQADWLLPIAPNLLSEGTMVTADGLWQRLRGLKQLPGELRQGWKVLRQLGQARFPQSFSQLTVGAVSEEIQQQLKVLPTANFDNYQFNQLLIKGDSTWRQHRVLALYGSDNVVRRAKPLQAAQKLLEAPVLAHPDDLAAWGVPVRGGVLPEAILGVALTVQPSLAVLPGSLWLTLGAENAPTVLEAKL